MKKILLTLFCLPVFALAGGLPRISDVVLSEIERLGMAIDLTDFPVHHGDLQHLLDLPTMEFQISDQNQPSGTNWIYAITDTSSTSGYYGISITTKSDGRTRPEFEDKVLSIKILYFVKYRGKKNPDHLTFVRAPTFPDGGISPFKEMMKKEGSIPAVFSKKLIVWIGERKVPDQGPTK